jgi:dihydroorotate dehydrogenase (fumarate)
LCYFHSISLYREPASAMEKPSVLEDLLNPAPDFNIDPPLLNSASPWATTIDDIRNLYDCPYTGGITIRTSMLNGCHHDPAIHQYTFFSPSLGSSTAAISEDGRSEVLPNESSSFNTLSYSPIPLGEYLHMIDTAAKDGDPHFIPRQDKPIILSVAGTPDEVARCYLQIDRVQDFNPNITLMMEINLSCPNILNKPPPAHNAETLVDYLSVLARVKAEPTTLGAVLAGIKTPPYTYQGHYDDLFSALEASTKMPGGCPLAFITSTNTLGSCLVIGPDGVPALGSASGEGIGGMAGSSLHPLSLGNVYTIRKMLDANEALKHIAIIGVGGVSDEAGYERMRGVGAAAVAVGTALGREGVEVFEKISRGDK